ncbi:MAG TPA: carboxypeptidase regulatory-like domain-containing protein [Gemmatimonadaceae bacterium]|jgi:hypothetical protein
MKRAIFFNLAAALCLVAAPSVRAQGAPAAAAGFASASGTIVDSLHNGPLVHANVIIEGTTRVGFTDADGHYAIDSIAPGAHRVRVLHAVLDTVGISLRTPEINFVAGQNHALDISLPGPKFMTSRFCNAAQQNLGPAALVGFVKDPDTNAPMIGAKVELVYEVADPIGRKTPRVRSGTTDSTGIYRICGIPGDMSGKVQVFRNGVASGEVPAEITNGFLGLRAFSIASQHQSVVAVKNDSGKVRMVAKGSAKVTGKVLDKQGKPLKEARVTIQGGGAPVLTNILGVFTLDSLPSGTQSLEVRKLGYSVAEIPVELSTMSPATANVTMTDAIPLLETMRTEAAADQALSDLGYLERKRSGFGYFLDDKLINHDAIMFTDIMYTVPGLKVSPVGNGRDYAVTDTRNAANGCVNYYVDGFPWEEMSPGDINNFVRPNETVAVEVYHGSNTPPQFQKSGQTSCATIVIWTQGKVSTMTKKKKKS